MKFSDDGHLPAERASDYAPDYTSRSVQVAKALAELRKIGQQEAALRARIDDLTRPYKLQTGRRP